MISAVPLRVLTVAGSTLLFFAILAVGGAILAYVAAIIVATTTGSASASVTLLAGGNLLGVSGLSLGLWYAVGWVEAKLGLIVTYWKADLAGAVHGTTRPDLDEGLLPSPRNAPDNTHDGPVDDEGARQG